MTDEHRKHSLRPLRVLLVKADRTLQDWYRANWKGIMCESCGVPFELVHHFVEKSQSSFLRFDKRNLIFLCSKCHFRHHRTGDPAIVGNVIKRRGLKWFDRLQKLRRNYLDLNRKYLAKQLKKYALPKD